MERIALTGAYMPTRIRGRARGCYPPEVHPLAKAAFGAAAAAYANHTLVKPTQIAKVARAFSNRVGKPMLTLVPPAGATLKSIFMSPLAIGDVNLHPKAKQRANGPGQIGFGVPHQIPVAPRTFACVFSYDTLEHLDRPDLALLEWHRVADRVFLVVPPWWTPEAWLSKWYIDPELRRAWPVWASQSRTIWLPSELPRAYDATTCRTPQRPRPPSMPNPSAQGPMGRPITPPSMPTDAPAPPGPDSNSSAAQSVLSLPIVNLLPPSNPELEEDYTSEEASSASPSDQPYLPPIVGSPSSTSVSSMMIVSGPDQEND